MKASQRKSRKKTSRTPAKRSLRLVHGGQAGSSGSSGSGSLHHRPASKDRWGLYAIVAILSVFGVESFLRLLPAFNLVHEPTRSLIEESLRASTSRVRTYGEMGSMIILPRFERAEAVAVGDSFVFGPNTRATETFPNVLGRMMNWTVANLGIHGGGLGEMNRMVEVGYRYQPRLTFYTLSAESFITPGNQPSRQLSQERAFQSSESDRPLFVTAPNELTFSENLSSIVGNLSSMFVTFSVTKGLFQPPAPRESLTRVRELSLSLRDRTFWDARIDYTNPDVQVGLSKAFDHIKAASDFGKRTGSAMVTVLIPSKEMVYGPLTSTPEKYVSPNHFRTYHEFSRGMARQQIPVLDLTEEFRLLASQGKKLYFTYSPYLSPEGHAAAADAAARFLQNNSQILLDRRSGDPL